MSLTGGKRKVNKSLKAWVAFVKKVQKEEKLSYKDAIHRAKQRKDKGEKWMTGGQVGEQGDDAQEFANPASSSSSAASTTTPSEDDMITPPPTNNVMGDSNEADGISDEADGMSGGRRRRRTMRRSRGRGRGRGRTARRARGRASRRN